MSLDGPSRRITAEPLAAPIPPQSVPAPDDEPARPPATEPAPEPEPAAPG